MRVLAVFIGFFMVIPLAEAAEDLSSYGTPIETGKPVQQSATPNQPNRWSTQVCAEILRMEKIVIGGPLRPSDRGIARGGLLMLEQLHCGIDISKKMAADQAIADDEARMAQRAYDEYIAATPPEAFQPQQPIILQVPSTNSEPALPMPAPPTNCFTARFRGGMSSTTCR